MRILIDARLYGLENAGLGRYLVNLVDGLAKIDKKNNYVLLLRKKYFKTLKLPARWEKVLADFRHYSLTEQVRLPKLIDKLSCDLVHFPHFNVPLAFRGKFVVTIHDLLMHKQKGDKTTTLPFPLYAVKRAGYWLVFKKAVEDSVRIIVPSNFAKKDLLAVYKLEERKVVVTYEGVDERVVPKANGQKILKKYKIKSPYFIYIGNAYPHKNLGRAIEAVVFLNKQGEFDVELVIVSARNVFTSRLKTLINDLGANEFVKILGFVPDNELGVLFKNSVAFVYPSLSEGFGLPGLEAMASGTLVLASDIPVFKEVYKDNVLYFNPYDFSSIEKRMEDALKMDSKERVGMIKKAQEFAGKYSWDKMAQKTLEIYEQSLKDTVGSVK